MSALKFLSGLGYLSIISLAGDLTASNWMCSRYKIGTGLGAVQKKIFWPYLPTVDRKKSIPDQA
jgi:hypothetical protein